jgi:hypothetical protein
MRDEVSGSGNKRRDSGESGNGEEEGLVGAKGKGD